MSRLAFYLLVFLNCLLLTTASATPQVKLPPLRKVTLENGLRLILVEQHEVPLVTFLLLLPAGSAFDPQGKEGLSLVTAKLLRHGTKSKSAAEISDKLDFLGNNFSASTEPDLASFSAEFLAKDLAQNIELIADVLQNPTFEKKQWQIVRQNLENEIRQKKDGGDDIAEDYLQALLFFGHPYGHPAFGSERSLRSLTIADITEFYEAYYGPQHAIVALVGDFSANDAEELLRRAFTKWAGPNSSPPPIQQPVRSEDTRALIIHKPGENQVTLRAGIISINQTDPNRVGVEIVNNALGGRFTSLLMHTLRVDRGLTYYAGSVVRRFGQSGILLIDTDTDHSKMRELLKGIQETLETFHRQGLTTAELAVTKIYFQSYLMNLFETNDHLARLLARLHFFGLDEREIERYFEQIDAFTVADVKRIIQQHFPENNLFYVLIGDGPALVNEISKFVSKVDVKDIKDETF